MIRLSHPYVLVNTLVYIPLFVNICPFQVYEPQELIDMDSVWGKSDWHEIPAYVEPKSKGKTSGPLRTGGEEV